MDYSTDEDGAPDTPVKRTPTKPTISISSIKESDLTVGDLDIKALTDEELQERLLQVGSPVTPIVGSTRRLFEKKLALALLEVQGSDGEVDGVGEHMNGDIAEESGSSSDEEIISPSPRRSPRVKPVVETSVRQRTVHTESSSTSSVTSPSTSYLRPGSTVTPLSSDSKSPYARPPLRSTPNTGSFRYDANRYSTLSSDLTDSSIHADPAAKTKPSAGIISRCLQAMVKILILGLLLASCYIIYISYGSDSPYAAVEEAARLAVKTLQSGGGGGEAAETEDQAD